MLVTLPDLRALSAPESILGLRFPGTECFCNFAEHVRLFGELRDVEM